MFFFVTWRRQKRAVQRNVKHAKREQLDKMLAEAEAAEGNADLRLKHNIINKLAPKTKGQKQALKMQNGMYAHTAKQELETYDTMVKNIWNGHRINPYDDMYNSSRRDSNQRYAKPSLALDATIADVRAAFRKCKSHKAMSKDTRPAELLHIANDIYAARLVQDDAEGEWGGLQHKSIRQPLLITDIMIHRAKRAKMDLAVFAGDIHKAFDCADHRMLAQALPRFIDHPVWPCIIEDRHSYIVFRFTLTDGTEALYRIEQGAVQGCSLGPLAFNIYYRAFLRHLAGLRQPHQHRIMQFRVDGYSLFNQTDVNIVADHDHNIVASFAEYRPVAVAMHSLTFVDDHLEMWAVRNAREVREIFRPFIETQQLFHLQTNFKKTQMAIVPRGRQSRKRLRSYGGQFTIHKGEPMKLQTQIKYLGSIIDVHGSNKPAVQERMRAARAAHVRLTPGVYRSRTYSMKSKIQLYKTHEVTVLLSGLDIRVLNKGELDMVERYQSRSLRHIARSPAHVHKETNEHLRERLGVNTIESLLQVQRLTFYRDIFMRPYLNRQVIAALFGHSVWDAHKPTIKTLPHLKQLHSDICALWKSLHVGDLREVPTMWSATTVCPQMQKWLLEVNKSDIKALLSTKSIREQENATKRKTQRPVLHEDEGVACDICGQILADPHAVSVHKWSKHRVRNPLRAQVEETKCPGCDKHFSCTVNARSHWVKQICVKNGTAIRTQAQIAEMVHASPPTGTRSASSSTDNMQTVFSRAVSTGSSQRVARTLSDYFRTV